jgi:hypothetical protein
MNPPERQQVVAEAVVEELFFILHGTHIGGALSMFALHLHDEHIETLKSTLESHLLLGDNQRRDHELGIFLRAKPLSDQRGRILSRASTYEIAGQDSAGFNAVWILGRVGGCDRRERRDDITGDLQCAQLTTIHLDTLEQHRRSISTEIEDTLTVAAAPPARPVD